MKFLKVKFSLLLSLIIMVSTAVLVFSALKNKDYSEATAWILLFGVAFIDVIAHYAVLEKRIRIKNEFIHTVLGDPSEVKEAVKAAKKPPKWEGNVTIHAWSKEADELLKKCFGPAEVKPDEDEYPLTDIEAYKAMREGKKVTSKGWGDVFMCMLFRSTKSGIKIKSDEFDFYLEKTSEQTPGTNYAVFYARKDKDGDYTIGEKAAPEHIADNGWKIIE